MGRGKNYFEQAHEVREEVLGTIEIIGLIKLPLNRGCKLLQITAFLHQYLLKLKSISVQCKCRSTCTCLNSCEHCPSGQLLCKDRGTVHILVY